MTIRRVAAIAVIALVAAQEVVACSGRIWEDNDLVENEPDWSANRRFCAVVRWHEGIADFTSKLAGAFFRMDDDRTDEEIAEDARALVPRPTVIAALYESQPRGHVRINEIPLDIASVSDVLVSDSGRYLVAVRRLGTGGCTAHATKDDPFVTIYRADGSLIASWKVGDVLEASDLLNVHISATFALRHESDTREVVVISVPLFGKEEVRYEERRIEVATGALLDEKRPIYPAPHVYVTPVAGAREYAAPPPECAALWNAPDILRIDSNRLYAAAVAAPLPSFPDLALKTHMRGAVQVDVLVSESGQVLCTRHSHLPFGIDEAASEAIRRWKFQPFVVDGHAVKVAAELLVHFKDVDEETWRELSRTLPPAGE